LIASDILSFQILPFPLKSTNNTLELQGYTLQIQGPKQYPANSKEFHFPSQIQSAYSLPHQFMSSWSHTIVCEIVKFWFSRPIPKAVLLIVIS